MDASVTNSNRRVRTRTHGGVAGVGGWPPPLCRSHGLLGSKLEPGVAVEKLTPRNSQKI